MSIYGSKRKYRKASSSQCQLGHLKLSIYEEASALVVTIFEARGLLRKDSDPLGSYVKLYLLPDPQKQTKEKTRIVRQRDPVFNQKFSFLLSEQDQARRLFISVWSHHSTARNEMVGCMSFLVADLLGPSKGLNGWYQLLDEEKGLTENMQVPTSVSKYESSYGYQSPSRLTFAVTLVKSTQGYGFSVHGHNPVFITQVEEGLPAHMADMQVGDIITEVEGTDVLRASGDLVVNIVRKCPEMLHLILYRDVSSSPVHQSTPTKTTPTAPPTTTPRTEGGATFTSPLASQPFLSQSFTSMRSVPPGGSGGGGPGGMSGLSRAHYSSQLVMSDRGGRRLSSPVGPAPVHQLHHRHHTHGGFTQVTDPAYGGGGGYYSQHTHTDAGALYSREPAFHTHYHPRSRGSSSHGRERGRHDQIPEESTANYEHRGHTRRKISDTKVSGGHSTTHARKTSAPGSYAHAHHQDPNLMNMGVDRFASTQPEYNAFGPPPVRHTVTSRHPLPRTHFDKYSMSQIEGEIADRGAYGRFSPNQQPEYTSGGSQSRALFSSKVMASNGSIGGDSAYASGLSNQSGSTRSPVDMEETTSKFVGRPEERGSAHPEGRGLSKSGLSGSRESSHGNLHHGNNTASRSSLSESRDSSHFGRCLSGEEEGLVDWETLLPLEQRRQRAINSVMNAEFSFLEELQVGMETYMGALFNILPDTAHHSIFLYIDELFTVCQELIAQLKARRITYSSQATPIPFYFFGIADIYQAKLPVLMNTFEGYLQNSHAARQEIALSFTNEQFTKLVQESVVGEKKPSIYSFIESGKEYLPRLTKYMMAVSYFTPLWHEDHRYLTSIIQGLMQLCPERDLVYKWEKDRDTMNSLQLCIGFGRGVQAFPIVVPGRLLLHEGEALLIEKKKKKKIWLMLFSDILLLTRRQGKILSTFQAPMLVDQLVVQDINCSEVTEFQISAADGTLNRLIRAYSAEEKAEWMQRLKERASGSLTHRRRPGDKVPRISNLPKIDAPRKPQSPQSQPMTSPVSTGTAEELGESPLGSPMSVIPEGSAVERQEKEEEPTGAQAEEPVTQQANRRQSQQLEHSESDSTQKSVPKRRSLFGVGGKTDRHTGRGEHRKDKKSKRSTSPRQAPNLDSIGVDVLREWEGSFDKLLRNPDGIVLFEEFLKSEFSEENIQFWRACERHKDLPKKSLKKEAEVIFEEFISQRASKLVNIDHQTTKEIIENMKSPNRETFARAQQSIYLLMARDSFVRFVKSEPFQTALKR